MKLVALAVVVVAGWALWRVVRWADRYGRTLEHRRQRWADRVYIEDA